MASRSIFKKQGFLAVQVDRKFICLPNSYAIDRFSRIYPPLFAAIIFYYITSVVIPGTPFSLGRALGNLLNLQGIACKSLVSPFWSLSYEVWFYVILGVFAHILLTSRDRTKLVGFILLVAATSVYPFDV